MHSTTRFLAVAAGGLLLAAAVAAPALAHTDGDAAPQTSTTGTHERMMSDHPGMARMHEHMMSGHTDTDADTETGAAGPTPTPTR